jgi:RES domain-containing protein
VICYRFATYATPLRTVPAGQPARYSRGDEDEPTQYLALHPLGPLAELMRNAELRTPDQIRAVQTRTWALDVALDDLLEITVDTADQFGITAEDLVADDRTACQQLAAQLRSQVPGLVVPSAALPATRNVVLFGPRVAAPYLTEPVSALDIPASITAERGRPLLALLDIVRFVGDPHPALEAWRQGVSLSFVEPDWALTREQSN